MLQKTSTTGISCPVISPMARGRVRILFEFFDIVFGSRAPGGNETEATPKDETEGGKEGGREGRKRPHVCSQLRRKLWQERCFCQTLNRNLKAPNHPTTQALSGSEALKP